ncbi:MAG: hypothetical protein P4M09_11170 [Devosia sp.]|nr:hypothetical protein [Devosia sp.]
MIVSRGWGALILLQFVFWAIFVPIAPLLVHAPAPGEPPIEVYRRWVTDKQAADLWIASAGLGSALTCLVMSHYRRSHPKRVSDPVTGETMLVPRIDDLWYVELAYWPWIFGVPALIALVLAPFNIGPA